MEENSTNRTVKKKFTAADKFGRTVKGAGGLLASVGVGILLKTAMDKQKDNEDENSSSRDDSN
jgi:hypothetical protein